MSAASQHVQKTCDSDIWWRWSPSLVPKEGWNDRRHRKKDLSSTAYGVVQSVLRLIIIIITPEELVDLIYPI